MVRCQGAAPRCGDLFGQGDEEGKKIKQKKRIPNGAGGGASPIFVGFMSWERGRSQAGETKKEKKEKRQARSPPLMDALY